MTESSDSPGSDPDELTLYQLPDEDREAARARMSLSPAVNGVLVMQRLNSMLTGKEPDPNELIAVLTEKVEAILQGDMSRPETILAVQVHTLDALFNVLTMRATEYDGHNVHSVDRWLRLAMKAQGLCRAAIETLAAIKNPQPTLFAQQANIGQNVQVSNQFGTNSQTRETESEQSKLLEKTHERLDPGATGQAIGADTQLEAVGAVHGTKDDRG